MRLAKGETRKVGPTTKVEYELEKTIVEAIKAMERHTKLTCNDLVTTALKRFISQHKDYLPDDYKA